MMQVIGICRFSYPAEGGVQREHKSLEERCAYLYDPTRLNVRFNCLETLTLPSIRGQSDADFTFAILIGDSLPEAAKDRLKTLTADIPQVQIIERESGPYRQITQEVIDSLRLPDAELCAQF
ncbi:MAG: glycosyltransferase, partial [Paracoccaceae bacterium]